VFKFFVVVVYITCNPLVCLLYALCVFVVCCLHFCSLRKVGRYQRGKFEEGHTINWPKEKGHKDKKNDL